jgi:hypothetical protein
MRGSPTLALFWDALENTPEMVDIQGLLDSDMDDLLTADEVDREGFEMKAREGERGRRTKGENTRSKFPFPFGFDSELTTSIIAVFGETIQYVFR